MTLVVPNVGEVVILEYIVNNHSSVTTENLRIGMYTNDPTIDDDLVFGDFTELGAVDGYARQTLTGANWNVSTDGGGVSSAEYNTAIDFVITAAHTFYGYFIINLTSSQLIWAERFDSVSGFILPTGGGTISITPRIEAD